MKRVQRNVGSELPVYVELFFLAVIALLWSYMLWESFQWRYFEAKLMPRLLIPLGIPFLLARAFVVVRYLLGRGPSPYRGVRDEDATAGQVMDLGFYLAPGALRRFFIGSGAVVGFIGLVWLIGWHTAIPVFLIGYMRFQARIRWLWAVLAGLVFFGLFLLVFDFLVDPLWNDPIVFKVLRPALGFD